MADKYGLSLRSPTCCLWHITELNFCCQQFLPSPNIDFLPSPIFAASKLVFALCPAPPKVSFPKSFSNQRTMKNCATADSNKHCTKADTYISWSKLASPVLIPALSSQSTMNAFEDVWANRPQAQSSSETIWLISPFGRQLIQLMIQKNGNNFIDIIAVGVSFLAIIP